MKLLTRKVGLLLIVVCFLFVLCLFVCASSFVVTFVSLGGGGKTLIETILRNIPSAKGMQMINSCIEKGAKLSFKNKFGDTYVIFASILTSSFFTHLPSFCFGFIFPLSCTKLLRMVGQSW